MMPHGFRRADYWLHPWQIRAIQRLAAGSHTTPSAVVRDLLTQALPASLRPPSASEPVPDGAGPNPPEPPAPDGA